MPYREKKIEKLYYSISEVAGMFDVNTSLIRFWESEFDIIKPKKNKRGNRMFTQNDIDNFIDSTNNNINVNNNNVNNNNVNNNNVNNNNVNNNNCNNAHSDNDGTYNASNKGINEKSVHC